MAKGKIGKRPTERVQIYLYPASEQDRIVIDVYKAFNMEGRASEPMRAILRAGVKAMFEAGDLPQSIVDRCRLDERLAMRRGAAPVVFAAPPVAPSPILPYDIPDHQRRDYRPAPPAAPVPDDRRPVIDQLPQEDAGKSEPRAEPKPAPPSQPVAPGENAPKGALLNLMK